MTDATPTTLETNVPTAVSTPVCERITVLANIIENLTKHRRDEDRSLAEQSHWLAVHIDEGRSDLREVILLAGIGLDLSQRYKQDDDTLGEELFFLFGEIAEAAVQETHADRGLN